MASAKMSRTRSRRSRQLTGIKKTRRNKASLRRVRQTIPPELRAPMSSEIEVQLEELVVKFGEKEVLEGLDPLVTQCKWNDSKCVANAIRRIAREK
jgi:hypothetical protein